MGLKFTDELADDLEKIYLAQERPRFYKWSLQLNSQFAFLEEKMDNLGLEFDVAKVRQNCDNLHVSVKGDVNQVARMDMALLLWAHQRSMEHYVVLEHTV